MAERKRYAVVINGMRTTLKLTADGAKKQGLTDKDLEKPVAKKAPAKAAAKPANKAVDPAANKGVGVVVKPADKGSE